jgi:hypothetical protein
VHDAAPGVIGDQRRRVALVHLQTGLDGLGGVVGAPFGGGARQHPAHQLLLGDVEQQHVGEPLAALRQHPVHQGRLRRRARKTVEHRSRPGFGLGELLPDQAENHLVGHELAAVHVPLRLPAKRGARLHGGAQDVARGDLGKPQALGEDAALRALARSRRAKEEDEHGAA